MVDNLQSLLSDQSKKKYTYKGVGRRIIYMAFSYFFIFISEITFLSLVTQLYDQMNFKYLGNISVFVTYAFFGLGNFISPYITQKFSVKWLQFICALIITGFISLGILVSSCSDHQDDDLFICKKPLIYSIVIFVTALNGINSAVLWSSQSAFMMFFCKLYPEKEGKLIGIFWSIFQLSQGLGSIMAFVLLKYFSQTLFMVFMTGIAGFGAFMLFFYEDIPIHLIKQSEIQLSMNSQYSYVLSENTRKRVQKFKNLLLQKEMQSYFSFFFMNGVAIAFYSSYLYIIIQSSLGYSLDTAQLNDEQKQDINIKTTYVFTVLGFSEILAAAICGKLMGKIHYTKVAYFSNIILQLCVVFSFIAYFLQSYALCFVCGFLWGFVDCFQISVASYICQVKFNGQIESFSIFRFFQGMGVMITILISIFMESIAQYYFIFVILCFQILSSSLMLSQFNKENLNEILSIKQQSPKQSIIQLDLKGQKIDSFQLQQPS
ncbi:MFS transporter (macronuclear) [Tetrahymena thermophila SB210]|uniref:MFS transporter n=1 Tax=Tetrahymena thermophila (strain SB210) TaxID=312017 RepID=Q248J3_TETTS|nr:MFS transporter [Tetrahymena thermophila SB210]EAS04192.2 MFS transporter [Tetrahymena thermophila SB210]|eukprot:XP_001024437.2 MFS transporter [Tetrahymena thermophila SB210]